MKFKKGQKVKQKFTKANRQGTIEGIWEHDFFINKDTDNPILYACKGEYKVRFDGDNNNSSFTFSGEELEEL